MVFKNMPDKNVITLITFLKLPEHGISIATTASSAAELVSVLC